MIDFMSTGIKCQLNLNQFDKKLNFNCGLAVNLEAKIELARGIFAKR